MNRLIAVVVMLLLAGCQSAGPPEPKETPQPSIPTLRGEALQALIVGKSLRYSPNAVVSTYFADGRYGYRDVEIRDAGTWMIAGDEVCITFEDGGRRCDQFAQIGADYYRIEEGGRQSKVEGISPAA
ncbi:MAG TPA: hypothetical protein VMF90_01765 [Rhizobiaceae bacterium]|nr:hypothetical protein [Rhizobiaceae bacterium]